MKKLFIIANWKSNKKVSDAKSWVTDVLSHSFNAEKITEKEVIVCPPFHLLPIVKKAIDEFPNASIQLKVGSQNISPFEEGAFTGEVAASQAAEFAEYAIIGHSERRMNFSEDDEMLSKKVSQALKYGIKSIFCIQNEHTFIPQGVEIAAYEPVYAIGSGHPDTPENANTVSSIVKKNRQIPYIIYGGSVNDANVADFTKTENISGVLLGKASLDSKTFINIIENA